MAKRRMTRTSLLADLRKLLAHPTTRVMERKLKICGHSTWEVGTEPGEPAIANITIYLDPRRDGRVKLVIHELLHIRMRVLLGVDRFLVYELEEEAICAWEKNLYAWLHDPKRAKALESWSKAIERKMR